MRTIAAVLLLLLLNLAVAQDLSKPLDYTSRALPLRTVLQDLGKKAGVKLEADSTMENEPLILRLNQVSLKEAMDKIAEVFQADWVDHQQFIRLERPPERIEAIRAAVLRDRTARFKASIDELVAEKAKNPPLDEKSAKQLFSDARALTAQLTNGGTLDARRKKFAMAARLPMMRLAIEVLSRMNPETLARLEPNRRVDFSTSPNALQLPLPQLEPEIFQEFVSAQQAVAKASANAEPDMAKRNEVSPLLGGMTPPKTPAKLLMSFEPYTAPTSIYLHFVLLDDKGLEIESDEERLGLRRSDSDDLRAKQALLRSDAAKDGFDLGPIAKEIVPRVNGGDASMRPLADFATQALLVPTERDPLSFATSDTILTAAEKAKVNAIYLGGDASETYALLAGRAGKTSLDAFFGFMKSRQDEILSDAGDWIEGRPVDPLTQARFRIPRDVMETFLKESYAKHYVSVDQDADLWINLPRPQDFFARIEQVYWILAPQATSAITAQIDSARLYGSLSQMQREEAAKDSLTLTYGEMPPEQRQVLADFVFYGQKVIKDADGKERDGVNAPLLLASEILPDGIPLDAKLEVTDTTEPVFETEATIDNYSYVYPAGIEEVATKLAQLEQPDLFKGWPEVKGSAFQLSKMRTVNLTFRNGGITISDSIAENPPPTGPVIPINKLMENVPEDIQKKLRAQVDLVLKKMEKFVPQRGDPATPAPTGVSPP